MKKKNKKISLLIFAIISSLFIIQTYLSVSINDAKAACDGNGICNGDENMFNCKVDCLPAGIPTKSVADTITDATGFILGFALMASVAVLIWGGIYYIGSSGSTEKADTAKKWIKYSLMGILIVGVSYAVVSALDTIFH